MEGKELLRECESGPPAPGSESLPLGHLGRSSQAFLLPPSLLFLLFSTMVSVTSKWHNRNLVINFTLGNKTFRSFLSSSACASPLTPPPGPGGQVLSLLLTDGHTEASGFKGLALIPVLSPLTLSRRSSSCCGAETGAGQSSGLFRALPLALGPGRSPSPGSAEPRSLETDLWASTSQ